MRAFLSTIGSRGDVQPLLALADALREAGHAATICAPPDFGEWVTSQGAGFVPLGPPVRALPPPTASAPTPPSAEQLREIAARTVRGQAAVLRDAVKGHDVLVAAGPLQFAARSVAEAHGLRYVFVAYSPTTLPSPCHPPAKMGAFHPFSLPASENRALWTAELRSWDELFGAALADERAKMGLAPVDGVLAHMVSPDPWLAADPTLAPAGAAETHAVTQTGAWLRPDPTPLPPALEDFLARGEPPVYVGFGSMRSGAEVGRVLLDGARACGRRVVVSRGWGELAPGEGGEDWMAVDELSHDALFPRVAAVVHHGGAGTTTTAALHGRPQVVVPHLYDQAYWGHRVEALGLGVALPPGGATTPSLVAAALDAALRPGTKATASAVAHTLRRDGTRHAAERLAEGASRTRMPRGGP